MVPNKVSRKTQWRYNKATYVIQLFHLMVFMCFDYLNELKKKNERVYNMIFILLFLIYLHNIPAMVTNYLK